MTPTSPLQPRPLPSTSDPHNNWSSTLRYPRYLKFYIPKIKFLFFPFSNTTYLPFLCSLSLQIGHWLCCPSQTPGSHPQFLPVLQTSYSVNHKSLINLPESVPALLSILFMPHQPNGSRHHYLTTQYLCSSSIVWNCHRKTAIQTETMFLSP